MYQQLLQQLLEILFAELLSDQHPKLFVYLNQLQLIFVYWNSYETKPAKGIEQGKNLYELLNASLQGVKRLFVLTYFIASGNNADLEAGIK